MPQQVGPPRSAGWFTYAPSRSMTASISLSASTMAQSPETKGAPNARRQGAAKLLSGIGSPRFADRGKARRGGQKSRSEEHTSELQSLMRISYAVFGLKQKK